MKTKQMMISPIILNNPSEFQLNPSFGHAYWARLIGTIMTPERERAKYKASEVMIWNLVFIDQVEFLL